MEVGTQDVNSGAKGSAMVEPDVDGLGDGDLAGVASSLPCRLPLLNVLNNLSRLHGAAGNSLVFSDNERDKVPLGPVGNLINLLLLGAVRENTEDHLHTIGLASLTDLLESVALGVVDANVGESLLLEGTDLVHNLRLRHAVILALEESEGHAHVVTTGTGGDTGGSRRGGAGGSSGGLSRGSGRGDSSVGGRSAGGLIAVGEGADVGVVSVGHSDGAARVGVGTGGVGGRGGVHDNSVGGHGGGGRGNGVGTSAGADVGGGLDDAGDGAAAGLDGGIGASDGRSSLDDGSDSTVGVGTAGELGAGGTADSGSVCDGQGGSGHGVRARLGVGAQAGSGKSDLGSGSGGLGRSLRGGLRGGLDGGLDGALSWGSRGSGSDRDGAVAGGLDGRGGLRGHGAGGNGEGDGCDMLDQFISINCLILGQAIVATRLILTGRFAIVRDDLGGAAALLLSDNRRRVDGRSRPVEGAVVQTLVSVTAHVAISNGLAGEGGRGGQNSSPHDDIESKRLYSRYLIFRFCLAKMQ